MRRLLTKEQIHSLIDSMQENDALWVENENERKDFYKHILAKGDHGQIIKMLKAIYAHKKQREAEGKRLHICDERFFKDAEQILYNEFQYVLNLKDRSEMMTYILARMEQNT